MKRTTPLKRTRMTPSKDTLARCRERRAFVARIKQRDPCCRACNVRPSWDVHEPFTRGRGGPADDERNAVGICRACHDYIHHTADGQKWATANGLLIPSHLGAEWLAAGGVLR